MSGAKRGGGDDPGQRDGGEWQNRFANQVARDSVERKMTHRPILRIVLPACAIVVSLVPDFFLPPFGELNRIYVKLKALGIIVGIASLDFVFSEKHLGGVHIAFLVPLGGTI